MIYLIGNKITKVSESAQQNNSESITNEQNKEVPEERYISPKKRQKIIDNPRLNIILW